MVGTITGGFSGSFSLDKYLAPTGRQGSQSIEGVVYANSGGVPGDLLAVSNQPMFSSQESAGWHELVLTQPLALTPGSYWLGELTGAGI
jgi:hypothetical protein